MRRTSIVLEALGGGALGGSAVGVVEIAWLIARGGAFDGLVGAWAWVLYGLAGAGVGAGVGAFAALLLTFRPALATAAARFGGGAAWAVLFAVVAPYVLGRDLFAERGLPAWAWLVVAALAAAPLPVVVHALRAATPVVGSSLRPALGLLAPWSVVAVLLAIGPALAPPAPPGPAVVPGAEGPGVLWIIVDTLRADAVDAPPRPLPALGALRARSVAFEQAWSASAWTRPSFATMFTGRQPAGHRTSTKGSRLPPTLPTIGEVLGRAGVPSLAVLNNPNVTATYGFDRGFSEFHALEPDRPLGASDAVFGLALFKLVARAEAMLRPELPVERHYRPAAEVLDAALPWLRAHRGRRHLAVVHLMEPHDPYFLHDGPPRDGFARAAHPRPDPGRAAELRARYDGEVAHLDAQIGAFLDRLREEGLDRDLAIVLTSDHGEEFHEHGGWWHGDSLHAEQTHVPLWIRLPGDALGGATAPWTVRLVDVPTTVAALLGVPPDPTWEGTDLLSADDRAALVAPPAAGPGCRAARGHPRDRPVVHDEDFAGNRLWGVRIDGVAWLRADPSGPRAHPERALYDVRADPSEATPLDLASTGPCAIGASAWASELDAFVDAARAASAAGAPPPARAAAPTDADRAGLCALGYVVEGCP